MADFSTRGNARAGLGGSGSLGLSVPGFGIGHFSGLGFALWDLCHVGKLQEDSKSRTQKTYNSELVARHRSFGDRPAQQASGLIGS